MSAICRARGLWIVLALATLLAGCSEPPKTYQGWVEANMVFVAPDETGRLEILSVQEGEQVKAGAPLFELENDLFTAEVRLNQAQVENAKQAFDRAATLLRSQAGTQKTYDDAEALLRTARARLNTAQTRLDRRKVASPVTGTVQQVYFRPGEMVTAGRPVLSILPPGNLKLRFFVPEAVLPRISYGMTVYVHCDGCDEGITARVNFISRSAEYTPPVIYSLEERAKLVFLIEALPNDPGKLRVGQPVDIALEAPSDDGKAQPPDKSRTPAPAPVKAPAAGDKKMPVSELPTGKTTSAIPAGQPQAGETQGKKLTERKRRGRRQIRRVPTDTSPPTDKPPPVLRRPGGPPL